MGVRGGKRCWDEQKGVFGKKEIRKCILRSAGKGGTTTTGKGVEGWKNFLKITKKVGIRSKETGQRERGKAKFGKIGKKNGLSFLSD